LRQEQEEIKRSQERLEEEERIAASALNTESERLEKERYGTWYNSHGSHWQQSCRKGTPIGYQVH
jgi:hypothetical protein